EPCSGCDGSAGADKPFPLCVLEAAELAGVNAIRHRDLDVTMAAERIDLTGAINSPGAAINPQVHRPRRKPSRCEETRPIHIPINEEGTRVAGDGVDAVR